MVTGKNDEDDVCIVVRQRSEPIEVFLARGVPKSELDEFGRVGR